MTEPVYFHVQNQRPVGVLLVVVGTIGLGVAWIFALPWVVRVAITLPCGASAIGGALWAFQGGYYKSWFADGRFYWSYPNCFDGRDDSCSIADIAEFQCITSRGEASSTTYRLLLRDGTTKRIDNDCIGGKKELFFRTLWKENRSIRFVELNK
jgi:hypothetical protein